MPKSGQAWAKGHSSRWVVILLVASFLLGVVTVALFKSGRIGLEGLGYSGFATFLLSTVAMFPYWRSLDEPSREAHKFAVFWGLGWAFAIVTALGMELMFFSGLRDFVQGWIEGWIAFNGGILGEQQGAVGFYLGILATSFLLGAGYVLVWIGWWARQRMGTKAD